MHCASDIFSSLPCPPETTHFTSVYFSSSSRAASSRLRSIFEGLSPLTWQPRMTTTFGLSGLLKIAFSIITESIAKYSIITAAITDTDITTALPAPVLHKPFADRIMSFHLSVAMISTQHIKPPITVPALANGNAAANHRIIKSSMTSSTQRTAVIEANIFLSIPITSTPDRLS